IACLEQDSPQAANGICPLSSSVEERTVNARTQSRIALFFLFLMVLALPLRAQESGDPPGRVARLSYMEGSVSFEPSGESNWSQASLNYPLTTGDRLWTDKGGARRDGNRQH